MQPAFATTPTLADVTGSESGILMKTAMPQTSVLEKFDFSFAQKYDAKVRATVPAYETMHQLAMSFLCNGATSEARMLVTGAGCGMELLTFGTANPDWSFIGVDPAENMLRIAEHRVNAAGLSKRVGLHFGFVSSLPVDQLYDGATAILVMHFLSDDGDKSAFLTEIAKRLRPGAPLVLVDLHGDPSSRGFTKLYAAWKTYLGHIGYDFDSLDKEMEMIRFVPDTRIRALLSEAGFSEIYKFYDAYLFGGWAAIRRK